MNALVLKVLVVFVAGWVQRGQQQVIDYLAEENRVLREQLGKRRLRFGSSRWATNTCAPRSTSSCTTTTAR